MEEIMGGMKLDREIAGLVHALNKGGIATISSYTGHVKENGYVWLEDGRVLIVFHPNYNQDEDAIKGEIVSMLRNCG